jgi:hypothetical protein
MGPADHGITLHKAILQHLCGPANGFRRSGLPVQFGQCGIAIERMDRDRRQDEAVRLVDEARDRVSTPYATLGHKATAMARRPMFRSRIRGIVGFGDTCNDGNA